MFLTSATYSSLLKTMLRSHYKIQKRQACWSETEPCVCDLQRIMGSNALATVIPRKRKKKKRGQSLHPPIITFEGRGNRWSFVCLFLFSFPGEPMLATICVSAAVGFGLQWKTGASSWNWNVKWPRPHSPRVPWHLDSTCCETGWFLGVGWWGLSSRSRSSWGWKGDSFMVTPSFKTFICVWWQSYDKHSVKPFSSRLKKKKKPVTTTT